MPPKYFTVERPQFPWGDYGHILANGMSAHLGRNKDGLIQLERTGPYIPPISFPGIGDIIVTDRLRQELESSGLVGLRFQPVIKKLIVRLDWQDWDSSASEPEEYPEGGEPAEYILGNRHSPKVSKEMGELWEVVISDGAVGRKNRKSSSAVLVASSWSGSDIFFALFFGTCVTEKGRDWFEAHVPGHVCFEEVPVAD